MTTTSNVVTIESPDGPAQAQFNNSPLYAPTVATVLVVDDESIVRDVVTRYLQREGFSTLEAADGTNAKQLISGSTPDLVVLDVMLPGIDGLELCRWIRSIGDIPVILLTAKDEESDRIIGLEIGADDYVTKPFSPRELVARVKVVLRRMGRRDEASVPSGPLLAAGLSIDYATRQVRRGGQEFELTALEFDLLWFLATHPETVFSRSQLLVQVWGHQTGFDIGTSTVTVHIRRLREKIELDASHPLIVQTVWGVGYRFVP